MLNNFIYAKEKSLFLEQLEAGNILDEAIVFIEETKEIWNHGTYFATTEIDPEVFNEIQTRVAELEVNKLDKTEASNIYATKEEVPTKTSELTNDSDFITASTVSGNYATKEELTNSLLDKQDTLVSGENIKTFNNQSILGSGNITIEDVGGVAELMTEITYADLVALRDAENLVAGMKYRIIDYETMTSKAGSQSAGHPFDLVITALDNKTLDEKCSAIWSERDTDGYFANSNLPAWDVRYCLDNDIKRFNWAVVRGKSIDVDLSAWDMGNAIATLNGTFVYNDTTYVRWDTSVLSDGVELELYILTPSEDVTIGSTQIVYDVEWGQGREGGTITSVIINENDGKGVIYRMIDENRNDVPYDFKNIQFVRKITDEALNLENGTDTYCYTFSNFSSGVLLDDSFGGSISNVFDIGCWDNVFIGTGHISNTFGNNCHANTFGKYCISNTFGNNCHANTFGKYCNSNTLGDSCNSNAIYYYCSSNTLGDSCNSNSFGGNCNFNSLGDSCNSNIFEYYSSFNTLGDDCYDNTLSDGCNSNTFGDSCHSNTFKYNSGSNTFGYGCSSNTFGNSCTDNIFGNRCCDNTFGNSYTDNIFGNSCNSNILGNYCSSNTFGYGCSSNTFGDSCHSNTFGDSCQSNIFGTADSPLINIKNYKVDCVSSTEIAAIASRDFITYVTKNSAGEVVQYTIDDILNA